MQNRQKHPGRSKYRAKREHKQGLICQSTKKLDYIRSFLPATPELLLLDRKKTITSSRLQTFCHTPKVLPRQHSSPTN